ncbi:MAG: hypothetical protein CMB64_04705 [Euryarchaeota archaeon]|nr:hypothetical protein [Euryarchaeota archaeon]
MFYTPLNNVDYYFSKFGRCEDPSVSNHFFNLLSIPLCTLPFHINDETHTQIMQLDITTKISPYSYTPIMDKLFETNDSVLTFLLLKIYILHLLSDTYGIAFFTTKYTKNTNFNIDFYNEMNKRIINNIIEISDALKSSFCAYRIYTALDSFKKIILEIKETCGNLQCILKNASDIDHSNVVFIFAIFDMNTHLPTDTKVDMHIILNSQCISLHKKDDIKNFLLAKIPMWISDSCFIHFESNRKISQSTVDKLMFFDRIYPRLIEVLNIYNMKTEVEKCNSAREEIIGKCWYMFCMYMTELKKFLRSEKMIHNSIEDIRFLYEVKESHFDLSYYLYVVLPKIEKLIMTFSQDNAFDDLKIYNNFPSILTHEESCASSEYDE